MGCAKKRIEPKILNYVNRNFNELFTEQVIEAVKRLPSPWKLKKRGRKSHDPREVTTGCILKIGFNQTYDGIESYLKESETFKKNFNDLPGHSVIHRGMNKLSIPYIRNVMNQAISSLRRQGMNIAVDSTGFRTGKSSIWYDIRIRRKNTKRDCIKLHISMDVDTGIIHWFTITPSKRHDSPEFSTLMKHLPKLGDVYGDKGYSSRKNCQIVADKQGKPYLLFRDNATNKAKGKPAWIISIRSYKKHKEKWLDTYHARSIVESVFSSIKRRWGSFLRSRRKWMQKKELSLKVLSYNIKQVLLISYAKESKIPLWKPCK
ncbi:MAG: IS5 family transposase [Thermotogota bacterium]|nr:IS5 family transposase [Thermotogota bacterium]